MTRDEIQTLIDEFVSAWGAQNLERLLACYGETAELVSPLLHTQRGIDAIDRAHQDVFMAFTDNVLDVHNVVIDVEGQQAVLVFTLQATQRGEFHGFPASGRRTNTQCAFVMQFKNGCIRKPP